MACRSKGHVGNYSITEISSIQSAFKGIKACSSLMLFIIVETSGVFLELEKINE